METTTTSTSWFTWPTFKWPWSTTEEQTPPADVAATSPDGVQGGRKRKSKKTRRGGKKSRKLRSGRKSSRL